MLLPAHLVNGLEKAGYVFVKAPETAILESVPETKVIEAAPEVKPAWLK